jgi:hypothetical protein
MAWRMFYRAVDGGRRKCAALDRQINVLVYELYDISADEIGLVEGRAPIPAA